MSLSPADLMELARFGDSLKGGNFGHAGRPGKRGGSSPRKAPPSPAHQYLSPSGQIYPVFPGLKESEQPRMAIVDGINRALGPREPWPSYAESKDPALRAARLKATKIKTSDIVPGLAVVAYTDGGTTAVVTSLSEDKKYVNLIANTYMGPKQEPRIMTVARFQYDYEKRHRYNHTTKKHEAY